jgi:hypothetical protein
MKTIIVIYDNSNEALHAAAIALKIAGKVGASLLIANESKITDRVTTSGLVMAGDNDEVTFADSPATGVAAYLASLTENQNKVDISEIEIADFSTDDLAKFIIKNNTWMMVKASKEFDSDDLHINVQHVLNRVMCPLLLVPAKAQLKDFEQLVYIADLRYCRVAVVRYLAELAKPYHASVHVDHLSAKGLPHMEENYAVEYFDDTVKYNVKYQDIHFHNIKERDIQKAVDVMINSMHIDLLAIVNHRFHFEEILGRNIPHVLPAHITIPLLIFPY